MSGMTRMERAQQARVKAQQMTAQAQKLEAEERELARKQDVARKAILGGELLASIRSGHLTREDWERLLWPCIADRDRQRLNGWPWNVGHAPNQIADSQS